MTHKLSVREGVFIVTFGLPLTHNYLNDARHDPQMLDLVLTEYYTLIRQATDKFRGEIIFTSFTQTQVMFDEGVRAAVMALQVYETMIDKALHVHMDAVFKESQAGRPGIFIVRANMCFRNVALTEEGRLKTDGDNFTNIGFCAAERTIAKTMIQFSNGALSPGILMPATLNIHITTKEFELRTLTEDPHLMSISGTHVDASKRSKLLEDPDVFSKTMQSLVADPDEIGGPMIANYDEELRELPPDVRKVWEKFDIDKNGILDRAEVREVIDDLGYEMREHEIDEFFDAVDTDRSGVISISEFAQAFHTATLGGVSIISNIKRAAKAMSMNNGVDNLPAVLATWTKYDEDKSGSLEASEIYNVLHDMGMHASMEEVEWMMQALDTDGSGTIEFDEFAALFTQDRLKGGINAVKARIDATLRATQPKKEYITKEQKKQDRQDDADNFVQVYGVWIIFVYCIYHSLLPIWRVAVRHLIAEQMAHNIFDFTTDLIFWAWFVMKLVALPQDKEGHRIHDMSIARMEFIKSFNFIIDVLILLPLDIIYFADTSNGVYGFYRLNKLLLLYYVPYCYDRMTAAITPTTQSVIRSVMWFFIFVHMFACLFVEVASHYGSERTAPMLEMDDFVTKDAHNNRKMYMRAFYWALLTLAGQVQGDGLPDLDAQVCLLLGAVLFGLPLYATVVATVTNIFDVQTAESLYHDRINQMIGFCDYFGMPADFADECREYYGHVFKTHGSLDIEQRPPDDLPDELIINMWIATGSRLLTKVSLFHTAFETSMGTPFLVELAQRLISYVVAPGQTVMRRGERANCMFFVTHGGFHMLAKDEVTVLHTHHKEDFFGELALIFNAKQTNTIVSDDSGYSNAALLIKDDFDDVMKSFPTCLTLILEATGDRRKALEEELAEERHERRKTIQKELLKRLEEGKISREAWEGQNAMLDREGSTSEEDDEDAPNKLGALLAGSPTTAAQALLGDGQLTRRATLTNESPFAGQAVLGDGQLTRRATLTAENPFAVGPRTGSGIGRRPGSSQRATTPFNGK